MELSLFFKSIVDQDECAVVVCSRTHEIIYMNPAAVQNYARYGGSTLVGRSILECHNEHSCEVIKNVVSWFEESEDNNRVHTYFNPKQQKDVYMIALRNEEKELIGYYEKHEYRKVDESPFYRMK